METKSSLYHDNPIWADVVPVTLPQQRGDPFFVDYTPEYIDLMGYFLAVLEKNEVSERALEIADRVLRKFPSHYSAWWYKYFILENIGFDFEKELGILSQFAKEAPKSFQIWHLRSRCRDIRQRV